MAKKKAAEQSSFRLFEQHERVMERRIRRQRALFIPHFLREAAADYQLAGAAQDKAYALAIRWADLETSGDLVKHRETSIDTQFLDQLFGEGLGYTVKTTTPTGWQLEHKYSVPGVGIADAALGEFPKATVPTVVVELKDALTDLDRDRSNGRTAAQQCWDYLNALPDCPWGIVSNFSTIRLYHRTKGALAYEEFTLQELRDRDRFNEFYCLFERGGLLQSALRQLPRAAALLEKTQTRQKEVGDELYKSYQFQRLRLIEHLMVDQKKPLDEAIRIAQKLLDRIIFIAFCEDRGLLPEKSLEATQKDIRTYSRATNPAWENFLDLFTAIDKGAKGKRQINKFNGGLFEADPAIDSLELEDEHWTTGFANFGTFDFSEEVNVEVLGHLFERSITTLEKLRVGGLFALKGAVEEASGHANGAGTAKSAKAKAKRQAPADSEAPVTKMPRSAERKRFGIYYTPPAFTGLIVERTVDALVRDRFLALAKTHGVDPESREEQDPKKLRDDWAACLVCLKAVTVCDPACGSGAFLIRAYDALDAHYKTVVHGLGGAGATPAELVAIEDSIPDLILGNNLYGVDLSPEGVEITQLALWIRSARQGKTLTDLSSHIVHGNSLITDPSVDPKALDWAKTFPGVFGRDEVGGSERGFSCVIGNPPWERVKLEEREFFAVGSAEIAMAANAADRQKLIEQLEAKNPELHGRYKVAQAAAKRTLDYVRKEDAGYPLTGKGDVNLYMLFAELARRIVSPSGRVGLLLPSGIATDHTTKEFFGALVSSNTLCAVYDFVNRFGLFPDVEGRLKFCVLLFNGSRLTSEAMDFVFWAERIEHVAAKSRHVVLSARDIQLLNPNTQTCPIFRSQRDADLTKAIYKRIPILIDKGRKRGGNPWGIKFFTMFHQTNDAGLFREAKTWEKKGYALSGNIYVKKKKRALPLLEAKMTREYDHRASWIAMNPKNAYMNYAAESVSLVDHQNPEFLPVSRYWVADEHVAERSPKSLAVAAIGFHDIARANDTRTMVACMVPYYGYSNKLPLIINEAEIPWRRFCCLAANVNSFAYDFLIRQKVGGANVNFFIVEQVPTLPPNRYDEHCPWAALDGKGKTLEQWISERVLKLSCTAEDMTPLAKACDFKGSRGDGVHLWKEQERADLRAELDAAFFHLYGVGREDAEYMLSTFGGIGYIKPDDRDEQGAKWERGSVGASILEAYDALAFYGQ